MARAAILSNGRLAVGLNEDGFVHDFYYPYVGLENLTTARSSHHKIGISIDGVFTWLEHDSWQVKTTLRDDFMASNTRFVNESINMEIISTDFIDHEYDAFCRIFKVINKSGENREIKLFFHQVFQISNDGRADTALYVPNQHYVLDYKGRTCLLINGQRSKSEESFDQYAVGNYSMDGNQGTYKDAEDGELSNNPVEHGGVDSVLRFSMNISANSEEEVEYWVVASDSQYRCERINQKLSEGLETRLNVNYSYWANWLSIASPQLENLGHARKSLVNKSLLTIKSHIDVRGGIIASLDSEIYNYGKDYYSYVWPRDGAYAIWPLMKLGYQEEAKNFFKFCENIITAEGYLMHKYQPDQSIGSTWHPLAHQWGEELAIQEDETAVLLFMIGNYLDYFDDTQFVESLYDTMIKPAANFIATFIDKQTNLPHASYDLWEEKFLTTTYTTASSYAGLIAAVNIADKLGHSSDSRLWIKAIDHFTSNYETLIDTNSGSYVKGFLLNPSNGDISFDKTIDCSSFYGCMIFKYYPRNSDFIDKTVSKIEEELVKENSLGLSPRYTNDSYFKSSEQGKANPWLICSMWLAQYHIKNSNFEKAEKYITNVEGVSVYDGLFPEQVNPETGKPVSVTPLIWSHAEYINTLLELKNNK